jgi:hypothetical protein
MKLGGITALYHSIPQGRFLVRQLLQSTRFRDEIEAVSPYLFSKLLYAKKGSRVEPVFAQGSIPEQEARIKRIPLNWRNNQEDDNWLHPFLPDYYHQIDRFHLPTVASADMEQWAEWHYFNFECPDFYGYLSFMGTGNILKGQGKWIVTLQLVDQTHHRYSQTFPLRLSDLPLQKVDYNAGPNTIRFQQDHYEIRLNLQDRVSIQGTISYFPHPGLSFPPSYLARSRDFESGYVIPAIRGTYQGSLRLGNRTYPFRNITGYHDHNWGIWRRIEWNWGHLYSEEYAIFFGEIFLEGKSRGLFVGVFDREGFLAAFRPDRIDFSDDRRQPEGFSAPVQWRMSQQKPCSSIEITGTATSLVSTLVDADNSIYFIQSNMKYDVSLQLDGKKVSFSADGNAETYVRAR